MARAVRTLTFCSSLKPSIILTLLGVLILARLTECSPRGDREGHDPLQGADHMTPDHGHQQEAMVNLVPSLTDDDLRDTSLLESDDVVVLDAEDKDQGGDQEEDAEGTGGEEEVPGGEELLGHLLQTADSLRRTSGSSSNRRRSRQHTARRRGLLNSLHQERHHRYRQLERLQTVEEPEVPHDDDDVDDDLGGVRVDVGSVFPAPGAVSPEALGLQPSSTVRISGVDHHGGGAHGLPAEAQAQHRLMADVIKGSRRAFNVTKLEYLKKEWCKTERFRQVVREEGCLRRVLINRFCYGQCNSFFIPKSNKHDPNSAAFRSCAFCRPRRTYSVTVTLICPTRRQRLRRKKVDVVKQCKCMAQRFDD